MSTRAACRVACRAAGLAAGLAIVGTVVGAAHAASANSGAGSLPRTAAVNLDFQIRIDKFVFLRIGDGAWPSPGGTPSGVAFAVTPSIPPGPTTPVAGNNSAVNWSGVAPGFSVAATGNVLPVEVRSNAGQVSLHATVNAALTSGANVIPMSDIGVSSSSGDLPAPPIPPSGSGSAVNVASGGGSPHFSQVTQRSANWTFTYTHNPSRPAGVYSGQLAFTASVP